MLINGSIVIVCFLGLLLQVEGSQNLALQTSGSSCSAYRIFSWVDTNCSEVIDERSAVGNDVYKYTHVRRGQWLSIKLPRVRVIRYVRVMKDLLLERKGIKTFHVGLYGGASFTVVAEAPRTGYYWHQLELNPPVSSDFVDVSIVEVLNDNDPFFAINEIEVYEEEPPFLATTSICRATVQPNQTSPGGRHNDVTPGQTPCPPSIPASTCISAECSCPTCPQATGNPPTLIPCTCVSTTTSSSNENEEPRRHDNKQPEECNDNYLVPFYVLLSICVGISIAFACYTWHSCRRQKGTNIYMQPSGTSTIKSSASPARNQPATPQDLDSAYLSISTLQAL